MNDENQNEYVIDLDGDEIPIDEDGRLDLEYAIYDDFSDLVGLSELKTIKRINIMDTGIQHFDTLKPLKSLEAICISNPHTNGALLRLREFADIINLKELAIMHRDIETMDNLDPLQNLERLELMDCRISKIQGIENLSRLKLLDLSANYIDEVNVKDLPPNLEELYMKSNEIMEVIGLETHPHLKVINFEGSHYSIKGLENIRNKEGLELVYS